MHHIMPFGLTISCPTQWTCVCSLPTVQCKLSTYAIFSGSFHTGFIIGALHTPSFRKKTATHVIGYKLSDF